MTQSMQGCNLTSCPYVHTILVVQVCGKATKLTTNAIPAASYANWAAARLISWTQHDDPQNYDCDNEQMNSCNYYLENSCPTYQSSASSERVPELDTMMGCDMTATMSEVAPVHAAHARSRCTDSSSARWLATVRQHVYIWTTAKQPCSIELACMLAYALSRAIVRDAGRGVHGSGVAGAFVLLFEGLKARSCTTLTYAHSLSRWDVTLVALVSCLVLPPMAQWSSSFIACFVPSTMPTIAPAPSNAATT